MNKTFTLLVVTLLAISSWTLTAFNSGAGGSQGDKTGSPGSGTCAQPGCHRGGTFTTTAQFKLLDSAGVETTEFKSGATYKLLLEINADAASSKLGFQIAAYDSLGASVGNWANNSSRSKITNNGGVSLLEQTGGDTFSIVSTDWTAPTDTALTKITFYASVNTTNSDFGTGGDAVTTHNLAVTPKAPPAGGGGGASSIDNKTVKAQQWLTVSKGQILVNQKISGTFSIIDLTGKVVLQQSNLSGGHVINLAKLNSGVYVAIAADINQSTKFYHR